LHSAIFIDLKSSATVVNGQQWPAFAVNLIAWIFLAKGYQSVSVFKANHPTRWFVILPAIEPQVHGTSGRFLLGHEPEMSDAISMKKRSQVWNSPVTPSVRIIIYQS
jgi:hypothetical protein